MKINPLKIRTSALLLAVAVVTGGLAQQVLAQNGPGRQPGGNNGGGGNGGGGRGQGGGGPGGFGGGMRDMMAPAITSRQIKNYNEVLKLTPEQKAAVDTLFDGYSEQAKSASEAIRVKSDAAREAFRDSNDPAVWTKVRDAMKQYRDTRKKADEGFTSDVKAILTPAQLEKWPIVERTQTREQSLRQGFLSGERVDLVALVKEAQLPQDVRAKLDTTLDQYAAELDRELKLRNDLYEKNMEKLADLRQKGDMEAAQKLIQEGREAGIRVRDINRKFERQIATALPDDARASFETAFKQASFPDVYRPSQASQSLKAAAAFKDLTPQQQEAIKAMTTSHDHALGVVNDKLATATEEGEMKFNIGQMFNRGPDAANPTGDLRREKRDLDRATTESLTKLLTPEQQAKLPKPDPQQRGGGGGGGRGRGQQQPDT